MGFQPSHGDMVALATRALEQGGERKSLSSFSWNVAGGCEAPVSFSRFARPEAPRDNADLYHAGVSPAFRSEMIEQGLVHGIRVRGFSWEPGRNYPIGIDLEVRCRKCRWCLAARAREWRNKALLETERAPRTWFATFTVRPDEQIRARYKACMAEANTGIVFERLPSDEQFRMVCGVLGSDITRYLKRVRKQTQCPLRYLFVAEKHKSGDPHWHALIHEVDPTRPLRKAALQGQWNLGFSQFKLADKTAAWYLCKYLSKDCATRVRSSLNYGSPPTYVHKDALHPVKCDPHVNTGCLTGSVL